MPAYDKRALASLAAFAAVFVSISVLAQSYEGVLAEVVRAGEVAGAAAFILLSAVFTTLLIPLDAAILVPLAANAWGPLATALMSAFGWTVGSTVSFMIARRYGYPVVVRLARPERLERARARVPTTHLFWWVLGIQAAAPMDLVGYAFGLFTQMRLAPYVVATALGNLVPATVIAYIGVLPTWYQLGAFAAALAFIGFLAWRFIRTHRPPAG